MNNKNKKDKKMALERPSFTIYHATENGDGSALASRIIPATPDAVGYLMLEIADQQSVGDATIKKYATFNWLKKITVRVYPVEASMMAMVLSRKEESMNGGQWIWHKAYGHTTGIHLSNTSGASQTKLDVSFRPNGGEERIVSILLTKDEAFALGSAISASMGRICFGD